MLKYIFTILYLSSFLCLVGQEKIISIQTLGKEDGLLGNVVNSVVQDKRGFIWIATKDGINRYDGTEVKFYSREQLKIKSSFPLFLYVDVQNNIWITSLSLSVLNSATMNSRSRVFRVLNPETNDIQTFDEKFGNNTLLKNDDISAIHQDKNHILWIATRLGEIFRFEDQLTKVFSNSNSGYIKLILPTKDEGFWIVSGQSLFRFNSKGECLEQDKLNIKPDRITRVGDDAVVLTAIIMSEEVYQLKMLETRQSNVKFTNQYYKKEKEKLSTKIEYKLDLCKYVDVKVDNYGDIWAYDGFKIDIIAAEEGNIIQTIELRGQQIGSKPYFYHLVFDSDNRAWIPTRDGLLLIENKLSLFSKMLHGTNISIRSLVDVQDSLLLIASYSGLKCCNMNTAKCEDFKDFGFFYPYKIFKSDSFLWIGVHGGSLLQCHARTFEKIKLYHNRNNKSLMVPFQDSHGTLWVGSETGLLHHDAALDSFVVFKGYNEFESLKYANINSFRETTDGLWVAANAGLYLINSDKSVVNHFNDFPVTDIFYIYPETDNIFWLGTKSGGLLKWDRVTGKTEQFTTQNGLANNTIYAILEDELGFLWLPSDYGLMRFDRATKQLNTFLPSDGIAHEEFNKHACFVDKKNGVFYLGGLDGITYFKPEKVQNNALDTLDFYPLELTILNDKSGKFEDYTPSLLKNNEIVLSPNQKSFFVKFVLIDFSKKEKKYAYKIEGLQKKWTYTKDNFVRFNYLPYGNYVLKIKRQGSFGQWSERIISIPITVNKPFYLKNSMLIMAFLLAVILIYLFFKLRLLNLERKRKELEEEVKKRTNQIERDKKLIVSQNKKLKELNNAKDHLFAIIGHELRGPLVYFQGMAKKLNFLVQLERFEEAIALGGDFDKAIVNINSLLDNLLNWGLLQTNRIPHNPENITVLEIVEDIVSLLKDFAEVKGIQLEFNFQEDDSIFADRNAISIIIRNLVINAIKFTNTGGRIQLNYRKEGSLTILDVVDNGVGMTQNDLDNIFDESFFSNQRGTHGEKGTGLGLKLCEKLMINNNGELKISNSSPTGLKVSLVFRQAA